MAADDVPAKFLEKKACFVTLTKGGDLRGCIGHLEPQEALYLAVRDNARNAALRDPRFPEVKPDEVAKIRIEISVLTEPKPLAFDSPEESAEEAPTAHRRSRPANRSAPGDLSAPGLGANS